jgi:hypothetical protein
MWIVAKFNWPFYLMALVGFLAAAAGLLCFHNLALKTFCGGALVLCAYFLIVSLAVSHFIYDCSDLYRWNWLDRALQSTKINRAIFCCAGFDETSAMLREKLPDVQWHLLDHYDEAKMTEPSIRRARKMYPPGTNVLPARSDKWPLPAGSAEVIFGVLAIHELRCQAERAAWFAECHRCLAPDGRIVLVEHVRNLANLLAFGPGFLHFHPAKSWQSCWEPAGLHSVDEFSITPFVRVFVLKAP